MELVENSIQIRFIDRRDRKLRSFLMQYISFKGSGNNLNAAKSVRSILSSESEQAFLVAMDLPKIGNPVAETFRK